MKFDNNTLKGALCAVMAAGVLMLGTWTSAQAQGRGRGAVNGYPNNAYGQRRREENLDRRDARRDLRRHQQYERLVIRDRWGGNRDNGNDLTRREWRRNRQSERVALRLNQRYERRAFKQTLRNRRRNY